MGKKNNKIVEKAFAAEYVANGLNGTQAYKALRPAVSNKVASVTATRMLAKASTQKAIAELLPDVGEELEVISEALQTERPKTIDWKDTHKFIETRLKLRGLLDKNNKQMSVNIGVFVGNKENKAQ